MWKLLSNSFWKLGSNNLRTSLKHQNFVRAVSSGTFSTTEFIAKKKLVEETDLDDCKWLTFNERIYPPQAPGEAPRPAFVCHAIKKVKYSPKKMWVVACFVRGKQVDDAITQLQCAKKKGAAIVIKAINEAIEIALNEHNVEYRSNLWIAESFASRSIVLHGIRRCAKRRITKLRYRYCNYYIRLEEGQPPVDYYNKDHMWTPEAMLERHIQRLHERKILHSI